MLVHRLEEWKVEDKNLGAENALRVKLFRLIADRSPRADCHFGELEIV